MALEEPIIGMDLLKSAIFACFHPYLRRPLAHATRTAGLRGSSRRAGQLFTNKNGEYGCEVGG